MASKHYNDDLSAEEVRRRLDYDPLSGQLTWKARSDIRPERLCKTWNKSHAGKVAGTPLKCEHTSYIQVRLNDRHYLAHRLAWLWVYGEWPEEEIDHRDGDGANNRWENLRPASSSQNKQNTQRRRDNRSGFKGVSWIAEKSRFRAEIKIAGKARHLGYFRTAEAAHAAYSNAARDVFGDFARAV